MDTTRSEVVDGVFPGDARMRGHVTELVGMSDESVDAAIDEGVARAAGPADSVEWFEVTGVRSNVLGGVHRYCVDLRLGLRQAA